MNLVKYYRRLPDGRVDTKIVRVTQTKKEFIRLIPVKPSVLHPHGGLKRIPPKYPTVAMANRAMVKAGWTRKKLWTHLQVTPSGGPSRGGEGVR